MNIKYALMGFVLLNGQGFAVAPDPLLTERSRETFTVDFDGLPLSLPVELKDRVQSQARDNTVLKSLEIGNVDLAYHRINPKTSESKVITGWIEGEAFKSNCQVQKELDSIRKVLLSPSQDTIKVEHVMNEKFKGYLVNWTQTSRGKVSGVSLELIDSQLSVCYTFSLAIEDFDGFSGKEIRDAISPLTSAIRSSLVAYANVNL